MLLNRLKTRMAAVFFPSLRTVRMAIGALMSIASFVALALPHAAIAENPRIYRVASEGREIAYAAAVDAEGNFYIGGQFEGDAASSFGVAKFDSDGDLLWRQRYGGSQGGQLGWVRHLAIDVDANVIATGGILTADGQTTDLLT
ncbi:MAG TPA: hypothetical protein VK629_11205, partial [Steroidobacteraceae bacterium]|nr:hypothetical protein [Steroidobacteraceae bacterium]